MVSEKLENCVRVKKVPKSFNDKTQYNERIHWI